MALYSAAVQTTYGLKWGGNYAYSSTDAQMKENVIDVLTLLDPDETPTLAVLPKTRVNNLYTDWNVDTLAATSTAGVVEGNEWSPTAPTAREKLYNFVQHFEKGFSVSRDSVLVSQRGGVIGVDDEYKLQAGKAAKEKMRDVNIRLWSVTTDDAPSAGSTGAAPLMGNIHYWARQAVYTTNSRPTTANVAGAFATGSMYSVIETLYSQNVTFDTMFMPPGVKLDFDRALISDSGLTSTVRVTDAVQNQNYGPMIDVVRTSLGRFGVIVDRWIPQSSVSTATLANATGWYLVKKSDIQVGWWRDFEPYSLSPNGDSYRGYVRGSCTVLPKNPRAIGFGYNVTT